jgi:hypothetical protein
MNSTDTEMNQIPTAPEPAPEVPANMSHFELLERQQLTECESVQSESVPVPTEVAPAPEPALESLPVPTESVCVDLTSDDEDMVTSPEVSSPADEPAPADKPTPPTQPRVGHAGGSKVILRRLHALPFNVTCMVRRCIRKRIKKVQAKKQAKEQAREQAMHSKLLRVLNKSFVERQLQNAVQLTNFLRILLSTLSQ